MAGPERFVSSRGSIAGIALDGQVPVVIVETDRGSEVARLESGTLAGHVRVPARPTGAMVVVGRVVFLSTSSAEGSSLVSVQPKASHADTIAALSTPHVAVTPRAELVFTQGDQIALLSAHGVRALLEIADVEVEMELEHRSLGLVKTRVKKPLSTLGRAAMTTAMVATAEGVVYATIGDTIDLDAIRVVPRTGGLPRVLFSIPDQPDASAGTVGVRLGPIAASGARIAVVASRTTALGGRFDGELLVLDAKSGAVLERTSLATATPSAIAMAGDRIVIARRVGDDDEVVELWTLRGTAWRHVTRRRGRGLAMYREVLWLGDGDALVRIDLAALGAGPSAKVTQLVELVRKAEGRYEKTSFQGKPALRITAADGSRAIKPVTEAELAEIEALLAQ